MARVRDWIDDFLNRHAARFGPHDWPMAGSEEWTEFLRTWITAFVGKTVTWDEADAASIRLGENPPNFRREHLPSIMKAIEAIRAEKKQANGGTGAAGSREEAEHQSRNCNDCCGKTGLTVRWHPSPDPSRKVGATMTAYCGCALGRWVKRTHANHAPELIRCIIDVADEESRSVWWRRDPLPTHSMGGSRYDDGPVSRPHAAAKATNTSEISAPRTRREPAPVGESLASAMDRAAVTQMFQRAPNQDALGNETSTSDPRPF